MRYPDHKRLDNVRIRNSHPKIDLHDIVKIMLVRMFRKKYPNKNNCHIYTEFAHEAVNEYYPDIEIWLKEKYNKPMRRIVIEIQNNVTKQWVNKMNKRYEDDDWICIPLKEIKNRWEDRLMNNFTINKKFNIVEDLRTILEDYV